MADGVEEKDYGYKRVNELLKRMDESFTTVGVHEDAGSYPSGESVAFVALVNEYGSRRGRNTTPARPFFRSALETNKDKIAKVQEEVHEKILEDKMSLESGLERIGLVIAEMVRTRIATAASWAAPNKASTVEQKLRQGAARGATPLNFTLLLWRSIGYKVKVRK